MTTLWDCIDDLGASAPLVSAAVRGLLGSTVVAGSQPAGPGRVTGQVDLAFATTFLGVAEIDLGRGLAGTRDFELRAEPAGGVTLELLLDDACFPLPAALRRARPAPEGHLVADGAGPVEVVVESARVRIAVPDPTRPERTSIVPAAAAGLVTARVEPPHVLLADSGFGVHLPEVVFDAGAGASPMGLPPAWTGLAVPEAHLHLPAGGPRVLPEPIALALAVGDDGSVRASGHAHWPAAGDRPDVTADVAVDDPFGAGLLAALPTSLRVRLGFTEPVTVPVAGPVPTGGLVVTVSWTRPVTVPGGPPPVATLSVAAAGGGPHGLVELAAGTAAADVAITAAAFADVVMNGLFSADGAVGMAALVGAGALLSSQVDRGSFVLTRAEATASLGPGAPPPVLVVDYEASVHLEGVDLGVLEIEMDDTPIALSYRGVRVRGGGTLPVELDYREAQVEVRSTGGWHVRPDVLPLSVPAVRFGQGSLWIELDLDVAAELGPIEIDRATLRVHIESGGLVRPELRGLGMRLTVPGVLGVSGRATLVPGGIAASLSGHAGPAGKGFGVTAHFRHGAAFTGLGVAVAFPGPIPLASSGFALFGADGGFAVGAAPQMADGDPIQAALAWKPSLDDPGLWRSRPGAATFWLGLVLGTLPDVGFSLNTHARLALSVPDVLFRLSLDGRLLLPPQSLADAEAGGVGGTGGLDASFLGVLQAGPAGLDIGLRGHIDLLPLLEVDIPVGAHFPSQGDGWFVRIGTDGAPSRPPGPIRASLLPDLFGVDAWAFLMLEGAGITGLAPGLAPGPFPDTQGFTVAVGAGFDLRYGAPPFWIEVGGGFVAMVATDPFLVAAQAWIGGSLHLGPFSIGADARIDLVAGRLGPDDDPVLWARGEVCGSIDLWLVEIEGCVTIEFGSRPEPVVTPPNPLVALSLVRPDGLVTPIAPGGGHAIAHGHDDLPTVWPDTVPTLAFSTMPRTTGAAGNVRIGPNAADGATGSDQLRFTHRLAALDLVDSQGTPFVPEDTAGDPTALRATVQLGKGTGGGRELAIGTLSPHLWARALEDGGKSTGDPASIAVGACKDRAAPRPGWTLGERATGGPGRWLFPPERHETDPLASMVTGPGLMIDIEGQPIAATEVWHAEGAGGERFELPWCEPFPRPLDAADSGLPRSFTGCWWLARHLRPGQQPDPALLGEGPSFLFRPTSPLLPDGPLLPTVCLLVDDVLVSGPDLLVTVRSGGSPWDLTVVGPHPDRPGFSLVVATWTGFAPVTELEVRGGVGRVGVLGIGGVTARAQHAADDQNDEADDHHGAVHVAATPTHPVIGSGRLFEPGREYHVVAQLEAEQELPPNTRGVLDLDGTDGTVRRFRIARERPLPAGATEWHLDNDESIFCPEYLRRYLHPTAALTPADGTRFVLPADPVQVRFWADHVEQLAMRYGYRLHLRIRRVDPHPVGPPPAAQVVAFAGIVPSPGGAPHYAVDMQVATLVAAGEAPCPVPTPGTTYTIPAALTVDAQFELRVVAVKGSVERTVKVTTFATSAHHDARSLLAGLGVVPTTGGPGPVGPTPGELVVPRLAPLPSAATGDHPFEDAMARLGLAPWPACTGPRRWHLWVAGTSTVPWRLHGILLEAPEPIVRGSRLALGTPSVGGRALPVAVVDGSGCRVLRLADPFPPTGPLTFRVDEAVGGGPGVAPLRRTWTGTAPVPARPALADEVPVS